MCTSCATFHGFLLYLLGQVSDKTDLAQRATALRAKLHKQHIAAVAAAQRKRAKSNGASSPGSTAARSSCLDNVVEDCAVGHLSIELDFADLIFRSASEVTAEKAVKQEVAIDGCAVDAEEIDAEVEGKSGRTRRRKSGSGTATKGNGKGRACAAEEAMVCAQTEEKSEQSKEKAEGEDDQVPPVLQLLRYVNSLACNRSNEVRRILGDFLLGVLLSEVDVAAAVAELVAAQAKNATETTHAPPNSNGYHRNRPTTANCWDTQAAARWEQADIVHRRTVTFTATSTTTPAKDSADVKANAVCVEWTCQVCTFVNSAAQTIACAVCLHARPAPSRARTAPAAVGTTSSSNSGAASTRDDATREDQLPNRAAVSKLKVSVVDLVSDDDEPVVMPTATAPPQPQPASMPQVAAVSSRCPRSAEKVEERAADEVASSEAAQAAFAQLRRTVLSTCRSSIPSGDANLGAISSSAASSHARRDTDDINNALNLLTASADGATEEDDEEGTDLVLLNLITSPAALRAASLETVVPSPPFFVVHGKRIGDPSRKGKSQFCGKHWDSEML